MDSSVVTKVGGFSEEALREISGLKSEPEWLRQHRLNAWRSYQEMPMPSRKEEEWRRTDISLLDLDSLIPFAHSAPVGEAVDRLPEALQGVVEAFGDEGGLLVQRDSTVSYRRVADELAARGVLFTDLDTAAREHGDLVRRYLGSLVDSAAGKFATLNGAFWSGGTFVYVPRNVELEMPLHAFTWSDRAGLAVMPRTLVVAEPGSSLILVDEFASADGSGPILANGAVELIAGEGARVRYIGLQRWGNSVFNLGYLRGSAARDAQLSTLAVVLGSRVTKSWIESLLREPGASTQMVGIMFPSGSQRFHHHTLQDHQAHDTTSDLLYKVALGDHARSEYSGLIRVHKDAQKTDAYQANRNLALSEHARADSMPKLEIEANDVRCTHGATLGPIDEEQIFYLMARGLPRAAAQRMIVEGFFAQVVERIPLESVQQRVRRAVETKLEA